jgi:hypothetical protein
MKIYIVEGSTGEYSDRQDWIVCAYQSKEKAEEHADKAEHRAKEMLPKRYSNFEGQNEFDPHMRMDYTGTEYYVIETELKS